MSRDPLRIEQLAGGQRNVTYRIRGFVINSDILMAPIEMSKGLKMTSALWIIQEKLCLHLWWDKNDRLLPMESRNAARFDQAIKPPEGWNGTMYLTSQNWDQPNLVGKAFFIVLDFDR
jgi:hypothetical protein